MFDREPATIGNGTIVSPAIDSLKKSNALHAKALELGGTDEGAPGVRMQGFYAAYFRDPDGNKLTFFKMG